MSTTATGTTPADARGGTDEPTRTARRPFRPGEHVMRNAWYGVALASKVRTPLARVIDGTPIVLWRDDTGAVRAVEDRCVHRRAPMSAGKVVDGVLQCPYHGWCYDGTGTVVRIPSLGPGVDPPDRFCVTAYPVVVRYGVVWLWWGDPAAADTAYLPDVPFLDPDGDPPSHADFHYDAPQELIIENLLDLTHLDFVHGTVFGDPFGGVEDITVEHTDEMILMRRISRDRRTPKLMKPLMGNPERQDFVHPFLIHVRSGVAMGIAWNTPPPWGFCLLMCVTPESPTRCRITAASRVLNAPWWYRKIAPIISTRVVTRQDNRIFRLQTPRYAVEEHRADKSVPADAAGLRYRSMMADLAERQARGDYEYRDGWRGFDAGEAIYVDGPPPA